MYHTYRACVRRIIRVRTILSGGLNNVRILLSIPNTDYNSVQIGTMVQVIKIIRAKKSAARPFVSLQMLSSAQSLFQVTCSNASPLPGANKVGRHDHGKHCLLSTYYSSTL